jgi:DNA modification methylase
LGLRKYTGGQGDEPLGLEKTPEQHIDRIVEIMSDVRRVLRDDGVLWLNYGDCYGHGTTAGRIPVDGRDTLNSEAQNIGRHGGSAGNLMMMPHRVALALQADGAADPRAMNVIDKLIARLEGAYDSWDAVPDKVRAQIEKLEHEYQDARVGGWIVRQDLVWYKRNPMPESVAGWRWQRERKRTSNDPRREYARTNENNAQRKHDGPEKFAQPEYEYGDDLELRRSSWRHTRAHEYIFMLTKKMGYWSNQEAVREAATMRPQARFTDGRGDKSLGYAEHRQASGDTDPNIQRGGRNPRSVLDIPTAPYKGPHSATFPPNLIAPLIRATCPRWACPVCGQGWAAVVEQGKRIQAHWDGTEQAKINTEGARGKHGKSSVIETGSYQTYKATGYRPTCDHPHTQDEAVPGTVFDPFVGSGTTVMVAQQLLRRGIGLDISMPYLDEQAKIRTHTGQPSKVLDGLPLFDNMEEGEE